MSHYDKPHLRKSYRHVWQLPDSARGSIMSREPAWAWAAFGPRGSECGVEEQAAEADLRSRHAEAMLGGTREPVS